MKTQLLKNLMLTLGVVFFSNAQVLENAIVDDFTNDTSGDWQLVTGQGTVSFPDDNFVITLGDPLPGNFISIMDASYDTTTYRWIRVTVQESTVADRYRVRNETQGTNNQVSLATNGIVTTYNFAVTAAGATDDVRIQFRKAGSVNWVLGDQFIYSKILSLQSLQQATEISAPSAALVDSAPSGTPGADVTFQIVDVNGDLATASTGATFDFGSQSGVTFGAVTDNNDGTYTVNVTSSAVQIVDINPTITNDSEQFKVAEPVSISFDTTLSTNSDSKISDLIVTTANGLISTNKGDVVSIFNIVGQKVSNGNLSTGIYIVSIKENEVLETRKVLVQ